MAFLVFALMKISRFPLSRCLFVFEQIRDRALERGAPSIAEMASHGITRVRAAQDLDQRQRALRAGRFPPEAREMDEEVDATINGVDTYCESQMALFRGQPRAAAAARIRRALLPEGVASVTRLPYADQHKQIEALLARAQASDVLADLAILPEMNTMLARVRDANAEYGALLRDTEDVLTRQDVRTRHDECQEILCTTACLIISHFAQPERHGDRDYLLEPLLREDAALRERRRRQRAGGNTDEPPGPSDAAP